MEHFNSFEEENISYWTNRTPGYSGVNQDELASQQRVVWRTVISERIKSCFPGKSPGEIKVLDVGTGPGFFAIILAELGYSVTAVDYTASMLEAAKENAGTLTAEMTFLQMDAEALTLADGTFDVLVTRNLTWNLRHPEKAYVQWARVLKPGGLLLNFDANWYSYLYDEEARKGHLLDPGEHRPFRCGRRNRGYRCAGHGGHCLANTLVCKAPSGLGYGCFERSGHAGVGRHRSLEASLDPGRADQQCLHAYVPGGGEKVWTSQCLKQWETPCSTMDADFGG